jgi:inner membrane transporter RhtA
MQSTASAQLNPLSQRMPPHVWFLVSAVFHYLGPAFAVMLFPAIGILGVAWFRIATAALFFAPVTKPWAVFRRAPTDKKLLLVAMGLCLAVMNSSFYFALERLPMSLVASMEFVGTMTLTLFGLRHWRNTLALCLVIAGVVVLIDVKWASDPIGLIWSALNAVLFAAYIVIGHKMAEDGAAQGIQLLGTAMAIAFLLILPFGLIEAVKAFGSIKLVLAAIGVGLCSSVIPYVCDQLAMARLPRASFALFMALLPVSAAFIAALVLKQIPSVMDSLAIFAVVVGIAIHVPPHAP